MSHLGRSAPRPWSRRLVLAALTLVLLLPSSAFAGEVEVTYLANEGFLIAAGETKVLVDALFGEGIDGYEVVPAAERRRLESAQGPYASVDMVLATHHHGDHFDPSSVGRHLVANPAARFVSTKQAVERLRKGFEGYEQIAERVSGFWPEEGETASLEHAGVSVTVLNMHHGRGFPVQNLGFVIEVGGLKLIHIGDTEVVLDDVRAYTLGDLGIDVGLVPYWFVLPGDRKQVTDLISPRHLVAMHMPREDAPANYFSPARDHAGLEASIRASEPRVWIPDRALVSKRFGPAGD